MTDVTNAMQNLKEQLPSTEDLLRAIGLQYERSATLASLSTLAAFAMGAVAGAVMATLYAPRSGAETRQELSERMRGWTERMGRSGRREEDDEAAAH